LILGNDLRSRQLLNAPVRGDTNRGEKSTTPVVYNAHIRSSFSRNYSLFFDRNISIMSKYDKKGTLFFLLFTLFLINVKAQQTVVQYLSGTDKDHTVQWDFMVNNGRNSGKWSTIPVPSCWEMQGFGTYSYSRDVQNANETGMYKHSFTVAPQQKGKKIHIVFEASMTDTEVKINGQLAGPIHQGGFYQFKYDITDLVKFGIPNLIEVTVAKKSANNSVNRAERQSDFWLFGGIIRPVYLEILPQAFIERVAIDAKANGDFNIAGF
jgi:hypothetical protein